MNTSEPIRLSTNRLELVAATLELVLAELESPDSLATLLNVQVEAGWPPGEYDRSAQEFFRDCLQKGGDAAIGWHNWYAIQRATPHKPAILVAAGGYCGLPNEKGEVEIGFSVMPAWQKLGYATELAQALVVHAFDDERVQKVIVHTTPANIASRKVIDKCGFCYVGHDATSGNDCFEIVRHL